MVRHGVRRLVVVSGDALAGVVTLDDLAASGLASELSARGHASRAAGLLLPRARRLTTASANARITGCARVPSPASSGWKSVPRKNGWPASSSERGAPSSSWAPKTTPALVERLDVVVRDPVGAVVALDAALDARDLARSACRACSGSAPSWPTSEHSSSTITSVSVTPVLGVVRAARSRPGCGPVRGSRAGSRRRCRGTGSRCSRAVVTAAITVSRPRTGCRGRPRCRRSRRGPRPACSGSSTGRARGRRAGAARRSAAGCACGRGRLGERSPTSASLAVGMAGMLVARARSRPTIFCGRTISVADGPALPPHVRDRRPARVVLGRRARARLHAVGGLPAHRGARGRPRRGAAGAPPGGADRGGRAAARARRADPAAARRRARRRRARGRRTAASGCGSARRRWPPRSPPSWSRRRLAVTVRVGARDEIARAVATGELDTGFVDGVAAAGDPLRLPETGARVASFTEEPLAVAAPLDHPLARPRVQLEDLVDARWIDAPRDLRAAGRARRDRARRRLPGRAHLRGDRRARAARAGRRRPRARAAARAGAGRRRGAPAGRSRASSIGPNGSGRDNPTPAWGARPIEAAPPETRVFPPWPPSPNPSSALPSGASPRDR